MYFEGKTNTNNRLLDIMIKDYEVLFQEKENKIMAMKKMSVQYYNERLGRKNGYDEFSKLKNLHINQK